MADETVVIISVLVSVVVAILGLAITGFWIYLCCGKHRDLVWRRHEPDPEYPSRPLRVVVKEGGVVTVETESIDGKDEERDEIVSLQPSIVPISRKTNIRRTKQLFASQPNLNYGISHSIGRMMESEPASHYQLSLDENDELLVDQGMFELNQLQEYDEEPQPIRASQVIDRGYDPTANNQSQDKSGVTNNQEQVQVLENLDELFPSSPALSGSSESAGRQVESRSVGSSEVKVDLGLQQSTGNGVAEERDEDSRRGSDGARSTGSNGELKGGSLSGGSKHSQASLHEEKHKDGSMRKESNDDGWSTRSVASSNGESMQNKEMSQHSEASFNKNKENGSMSKEPSVNSKTSSRSEIMGSDERSESHTSITSSQSSNESQRKAKKAQQSGSSSSEALIVRKVATMTTKDTLTTDTVPVTADSTTGIDDRSPLLPQHVPMIVIETPDDGGEEENDGLINDEEIFNEDTEQLIQDNGVKDVVKGISPSSSPGRFRTKPSLIDESGSESSLENGIRREGDTMSNGSTSPRSNVSPSSRRSPKQVEKKLSQTSVSSPLASVSHRAETVGGSSSAVSITSDTESETDLTTVTSTVQQPCQPKQAIMVKTESGSEIFEIEEVEKVIAKQPERKRKVTPAIQDPEKHMRQLMSMLSESGSASKSLGFIQEEGSAIIEEEEEEDEDDEGDRAGFTRF